MKPSLLVSYRLSKEYNNKFWMNMLIMGILFITILNTLSITVADPDLWGNLAFGRLFWESGRFPYQDVYSYVPTLNPWICHEWLTGVIFYPLYKETGALGLQFIRYLISILTVVLIYLTARKRGADLLGAAVALFITIGFLGIGYSPVRAQVFTYCFFALTLYLLEKVRRTGRWHVMFVIPIIMIIWCNLHGGFVAGLGLIALYLLGEFLSRHSFLPYLWILLLSGIATLVNPYGLKYWAHILYAVTIMPKKEISEWVSILQLFGTGSSVEFFYYSLIIVIFLLLIWWGKWRDITAGLVLSVTLYVGLSHTRHMVFFLILTGAYMPVLLTPYIQRVMSWSLVIDLQHRLGKKIPAFLSIVLISYGAYNFLCSTPWTLRIPSKPQGDNNWVYYPVAAINFIKDQSLSGNLIIFYDWGEYALWRLYPQCRVAIDGRYEVYPETVRKEYFDFFFVRENWERFLKHYPPDMLLIKTPSKIYSLIQKEPDWRQVFADSGSALFLHQDRQ